MKTILPLLIVLGMATSGCVVRKVDDTDKPNAKPAAKTEATTPAPAKASGTPGQIIDNMTGKTDVDAYHRAANTIKKVNAQENKDINDAMLEK